MSVLLLSGISIFLLALLSLQKTSTPLNFAIKKSLLTNTVKNSSSSASLATTSATPAKESQKAEIYTPQINGRELRVPILLYHYIGNNPNPKDIARDALSISPDKFTAQMKYLHDNGYNTITLDSLYPALMNGGSLPPKPVIVTVDDGYEDFYYNAYQILRQYGIHATVFIPTGLMNQGYYLTWAQIKEMAGSGLITYGAHSVHHYNLPSLSISSLDSELTESKKVLQDELGVPINFMAYPGGASSNLVVAEVQKAGYLGAVGTWASKMQSEGTIYNMPRIKVSGSIDLAAFANLL